MKIRWATGHGTKTFDGNQGNALAKSVSTTLAADLEDVAANSAFADVMRLKTRIERVASREMMGLMPFIAKNLVGVRSSPGSVMRMAMQRLPVNDMNVFKFKGRTVRLQGMSRVEPRGSLDWKPLSSTTIQRKGGINSDAYFLHKGNLRRAISNSAGRLLNLAGSVRVDVKDGTHQKGVTSKHQGFVGTMTIRVAPGLHKSDLPALQTGQWNSFDPQLPLEKRLGFSENVLKKLRGPMRGGYNIVHRPLIQPALGFWILNKIPGRIAQMILGV